MILTMLGKFKFEHDREISILLVYRLQYLQDNVGISHVEFTIIRFWQWNWLKVLNSPNFSPSTKC